jgi:hypothetical protein
MSNNKKQQTPVEWLEETMLKPLIQWPDDIWEQAKEMENEQRKKIWDEALKSVEKKLELLKEIYGGNK